MRAMVAIRYVLAASSPLLRRGVKGFGSGFGVRVWGSGSGLGFGVWGSYLTQCINSFRKSTPPLNRQFIV